MSSPERPRLYDLVFIPVRYRCGHAASHGISRAHSMAGDEAKRREFVEWIATLPCIHCYRVEHGIA